jgi:hypothetical protein
MAGILVDFTIGERALVAATAQTVIQCVNAAHHRYKLLGFQVSFDGIVVTAEPVLVELCHIAATGGDGTSSSLTGLKRDSSLPETVQTTGLKSFTAEPTTVTVLKRWEVHPQSSYEWQAPYGQEYQFGGASAGADSGRVAIRCTAPAAVNVCASLLIEE